MPEKDFQRLVSSREGRSDLIGNIMTDMVIGRTRERLRSIARGLEPEDVETAETSQEIEAPAETTLAEVEPAEAPQEIEAPAESPPSESEVVEESNTDV
jgi:hypothetical protein